MNSDQGFFYSIIGQIFGSLGISGQQPKDHFTHSQFSVFHYIFYESTSLSSIPYELVEKFLFFKYLVYTKEETEEMYEKMNKLKDFQDSKKRKV